MAIWLWPNQTGCQQPDSALQVRIKIVRIIGTARKLFLILFSFIIVPVIAEELIEEIMVQARKFQEPLFSTPGSVTVIVQEDESNNNKKLLTDISKSIPNFGFINVTKNQTSLAIRGAFSAEDSAGTDQPVAFYVDGIYRSRMPEFQFELIDLDRIEVLLGPRGTSFGRNVMGGSINVYTKRPASTRQGFLDFTIGNYNRFDLRAKLEGPLSTENHRASLTFSSSSADGWSIGSINAFFREISK